MNEADTLQSWIMKNQNLIEYTGWDKGLIFSFFVNCLN